MLFLQFCCDDPNGTEIAHLWLNYMFPPTLTAFSQALLLKNNE